MQLNQEQKQAIGKIILSERYHLVHGLSNCGKKKLAFELIKFYDRKNHKVLIVSEKKAYLDNFLSEIKKDEDFTTFIRVESNLLSASPNLQENIRTTDMFSSHEEIRDTLDTINIYGATISQLSHGLIYC